MSTELAYKVLRKINGRYFSSMVTLNGWKVEYKIGEWARPQIKRTKLLAFSTFHAAMCFYRKLGSFAQQKIVRCEIKNQLILPTCKSNVFEEEQMKSVWGLSPIVCYSRCFERWPNGTIAVESIRPIEEVSLDD
jgi:hypothetical protein